MSVPVKYREIGDFHEYYSGARTAPYLTIFVGGNHEASNYLWELSYGGWVAPNIYYMGAANVIRLGPLRIAGLSGIWKGYNYRKPHHERLPYNQDDVKSIYHVREVDTRKLLQVRTQIDVGISHDWPRGVEWKGNWKELFRRKNHFEADARDGSLGSVAAEYVLKRLRPSHWFSAHLHIKYPAVVEHESLSSAETRDALETDSPTLKGHAVVESGAQAPATAKNEDEIDLDVDDMDDQEQQPQPSSSAAAVNTDEIELDIDEADTVSYTKDGQPDRAPVPSTAGVSQDIRAQLPASFTRPPADNKKAHASQTALPTPDITNQTTRFLALDKCLPNRDFLQILDIEPFHQRDNSGPVHLEYDKEWLAITRVFAKEVAAGDAFSTVPPDKGEAYYRPLIEQEEAWIDDNLVKANKMVIPQNFTMSASPYDAALGERVDGQPREYSNAQTQAFCDRLQIANPFHSAEEEILARMAAGPRVSESGFAGGSRGRGSARGAFGPGRGGRGGGRGRGRGRGSRGGGGRGRAGW